METTNGRLTEQKYQLNQLQWELQSAEKLTPLYWGGGEEEHWLRCKHKA